MGDRKRTKDELAAIHAADNEPGTGRPKGRRVSLMRARRKTKPAETEAPEIEQPTETVETVEDAQAETAELAGEDGEMDTAAPELGADGDLDDFIPSEPDGESEPAMSEEELAAESERVEQAQSLVGQFMPRPGSGELLSASPEEVKRIDAKMKVALLGPRVKDSKNWTYNLDEGGMMTTQYGNEVVGLFDPLAPALSDEDVKALDEAGLSLHKPPKNLKKGLAAPVIMDLGAYVKALDPYNKAHFLPLGNSLYEAKYLRQVAAAFKGLVEVRTGTDHPALITKGSRGAVIAPRIPGEGEERVDPVRSYVRDMAGKAGPFHALNSVGAEPHLEHGRKLIQEREARNAERRREVEEYERQQAAAEKARAKEAKKARKSRKKAKDAEIDPNEPEP